MTQMLAQLYHWFGSGAGAASILVALIALVGATSGVLTSYIVAGRSVYINSITAERSKWIEKLRVNIAAYSSLLAHMSFKILQYSENKGPDEAVFERLEELNNTVSLLQLQLNPWGEIDGNILSILENVTVRVRGHPELLNRADKLLIAHSQWLLKAEWEKVKYEARGPLHRIWHRGAEVDRMAKYRKWAQNEGSIVDVLADFRSEQALPSN